MSLNSLADGDHDQEDLLESPQYRLGGWAGGAPLWIAGIKPLKFLPFLSQLTANGEFKQAQYQFCLSNDQNIALSHIHRGMQELPSEG